MSNDQPDLKSQIEAREADFTRLILNRVGIVLPEKNACLAKTITDACELFHCSAQEYLRRLSVCTIDSAEIEHLISAITVGETYFFRDEQQIRLLTHTLLPRLIKQKREQANLSLRMWSAGCSSGEEIYTIAMLLDQLLPDLNHWSIHLLGTDINTCSLRQARSAQFSKWSMRTIPEYYKNKYFIEDNGHYILDPKIAQMVDFQYLNLNDNTYPSILNGTNAQDLILCRNVFIYFSNATIAKMMKKISASLVHEGVILLGASDPICIEDTDLILHHHQGLFLSRKKSSDQTEKNFFIKKQVHLELPPIIKITEARVNDLLERGNWQDLLNLLDDASSNALRPEFVLSAKAKALASLGQLDKALACCEKNLALDVINKQTHFLYALILIELDQLRDAESALRKALFLDYQFVEAHYQLGLLLFKKNQIEAGLKSLNNALMVVEKNDASINVDGFPWMTYGRLAKILKAEIELFKVARSAKDDNRQA